VKEVRELILSKGLHHRVALGSGNYGNPSRKVIANGKSDETLVKGDSRNNYSPKLVTVGLFWRTVRNTNPLENDHRWRIDELNQNENPIISAPEYIHLIHDTSHWNYLPGLPPSVTHHILKKIRKLNSLMNNFNGRISYLSSSQSPWRASSRYISVQGQIYPWIMDDLRKPIDCGPWEDYSSVSLRIAPAPTASHGYRSCVSTRRELREQLSSDLWVES
jgi:hypothetical protein